MKRFSNYTNSLDSLPISDEERHALSTVMDKYMFRANDYYLSLINWEDPEDPIRRIIVPHMDEAADWGALDPSNESNFTVMPGLQHKYQDTCIMLANDDCGGLCRFCFRKRIFMDGSTPVKADIDNAVAYIAEHTEITNVLISGGDPLLLPTKKIDEILSKVAAIPHVQFIRIGSRMPVFDPARIINDPELVEILGSYSIPGRKVYIQTHFNHPNEITEQSTQAVHLLQRAGILLTNQTPLLRGVNADPAVLGELFSKLAAIGVPPYYLFVCRPTTGNSHFTVPVEEGYAILQQAMRHCSGPAKRVRFSMSHATGKIEVLAVTDDQIILRRHRTPDPAHAGELLTFARNPNAVWLDDYYSSAGTTVTPCPQPEDGNNSQCRQFGKASGFTS